MWKALLSCMRTQLIFIVLKQGLLLSLLTEKVTGAEQSVVGTLENSPALSRNYCDCCFSIRSAAVLGLAIRPLLGGVYEDRL